MRIKASIESKVLLGFGGAVVVLLLMGTLALRFAEQYINADRWVRHTQKVLLTLDQSWGFLNEAESAQRGFLITSNPIYLAQRQTAIKKLFRLTPRLPQLVTDNPLEERRARALEHLVHHRLVILNTVLAEGQKLGFATARRMLRAGVGIAQMQAIRSLVAKMQATETGLQAMRQQAAERASSAAMVTMLLTLVGASLLLSWLFLRIRQDLAERHRAEEALAEAERSETTKNLVLSLFTASFDVPEILKNVLQLLAERHPFPVSAFYRYDEWSGSFVLGSHWGNAATLVERFTIGEGVIGQAALTGVTQILDTSVLVPGLELQTGLYSFQPAAIVISPIMSRDQHLAVLVLAASRPLSARDQTFIGQLSGQLAVALRNIKQYDDLHILSQELRKRSEGLAQKNLEMEAANRAKSEFLANVSHELRTPLNAIIGFSEALKDGLLGDLSTEQQDALSDIHMSGEHLLSLINDILDLSKIEAGKMTLDLEITNPSELLKSCITIVREKAIAHRLHLDLDLAEDLAPICVDVRKIKQILYNLLSNAVKFTPDGGRVTLHAHAFPATQDPAFALCSQWLEIAITDTGIGISAHDLARLFQPFMQVDSSLARKYEGTGLGLALVKRLAELHGGFVRVESTPGQGSCFRVYLPYREQEKTLIPKAVLTPSAQAPQVLVIEADDEAAALICQTLEGDGFHVQRVARGDAALPVTESWVPDLIVLDILLPDMDGWDLLERVRRTPRLSDIPIVIMSVDAKNHQGVSLGAAKILEKPVGRETLQKAIEGLGVRLPVGRFARILVVDDDPRTVNLLRVQLTESGHEVLCAYDGRDGLEQARHFLPDVILLDLMMPEFNGFDVVAALQGQAATASIPVLVLTAKIVSAADRQRLNGHVVKIMKKAEFSQGRLLREVWRALGEVSRGTHSAD